MKLLKLATFVSLALAFAGLTGCASNAHIETPEDFAELEAGDSFDYRATNASGVVIGVRVEDNDPHGNLAFWVDALDQKLEKSGYARMTPKPEKIATKTLEGARVKYEKSQNGRPHAYWLTVFVDGDRIVLVEAAGDTAFFDKSVEKKLDDATRTLDAG